ncbi:MFS transporter [Streptomyces sp. NPDC101132]|uniref:MFS transporter n=1 Tax=Streptomyces sp. NPDC101132 TaxID=3366110 RepID=UPI0037FAC14E
MRRTFQSLSVRNFRLYALGQLMSVTCTWMMIVAQDWLVLGLSGDSGTALGAITAAQFAPVLLLTLYGGRLADRHDKRRILVLANLAAGVLALALALWVVAGGVRLWHIGVFAVLLGAVNAVEAPTRMSFISELVGTELLPNASALSAAYFNTARVAGPALAGLLISGYGVGPVMLLNAVSYLATVVSLVLMRPDEMRGGGAGRARDTRVVDGLRYLRSRSDLLLPIGLVAVNGLFAFNFQLTLPLLAKTVFGAGSTTFGLLSSALAVGSLVAAFATTARRGRPSAGVVTGGAVAFGALEALTGFAPSLPVALVLLAATGYAMSHFAQSSNHRIQLGSDPRYRGRVMAVYTLIFQGSTPVGAVLTGLLSEEFGARWGMTAGGLVSLAAGLGAWWLLRRGYGVGAVGAAGPGGAAAGPGGAASGEGAAGPGGAASGVGPVTPVVLESYAERALPSGTPTTRRGS